MKLDFSLENMEMICEKFMEIIEECITEFDDKIQLSGEGQSDYFDIVIIKEEQVVGNASTKYIIIYDYYLSEKLDELAMKTIEQILSYSEKFKASMEKEISFEIIIDSKNVDGIIEEDNPVEGRVDLHE